MKSYPITINGDLGFAYELQTESWSGTGEIYTILVYKEDVKYKGKKGDVTCSCMDASCRRKRGFLLDPASPLPCKHAKAALKFMQYIVRVEDDGSLAT